MTDGPLEAGAPDAQDEAGAPDAQDEAGAREAQDEAGAREAQERARAIREQLKQLHAADLGYEMALSLVSFGSQKLGLSDATADLRDLDDARLSIELLRALLDVLDERGGGAPAGELRDTLAQLQLGYAQAVQMAAAPPGAPAQDEPGEEAAPGEAAGHAAGGPGEGDGTESPAAERGAQDGAAQE
jgi:hypothetical protein